MENIQQLQVVFTIEADNFRMLHWKSAGRGFDRAHKISGDYYDMIGADIDGIAEIMLRDGINPLTLAECVAAVDDVDGVRVSPDTDYNVDAVINYADEILKVIVKSIGKILEDYQDTESIGIKSYFEGLYDKYDKEWRYLNARRMRE